MNRRFNIIRSFLRRNATTQPNAPNGDSTLKQAPLTNAPGGEPLLVEATAATVGRTTPVQIVLIALGVIGFLYFARPVVLPIFLARFMNRTPLNPNDSQNHQERQIYVTKH